MINIIVSNEQLAVSREQLAVNSGRRTVSRVKKGCVSLLLIALCSLLTVLSCDNLLEPPKDAPGAIPAGYGRVAVTLNGAARTVFPTMAFEKIEYTFAKVTAGTPGTPAAQEPVDGYFALELGDWQVTVKAYAKTADTSPAGTGTSATFTVGAANTANVSVKLAENIAAGSEGTFSYHITYPAEAVITVFSLEKLLGTTSLIDLTPATTSVSPYSGTEENISAGIYWLTIKLEKDGVTTGANEAVYIYDKLDSEYSAVFSEENFYILTYVITGEGTEFTATRDGVTVVGTAAQPIQDVITAIRADAAGAEVTVQFGDNTTPLNISTASASFNNTDGTWGLITLTGKITSENVSQGTVRIGDGVSVTSTADIANTADDTNGRTIYNANTNTGGTVTISGGTVSATTGRAIFNSSSGAVNISGGTVSATTGRAVQNNSSGAVTISGGTVSATTSYTVANTSGAVTISGGTVSATSGRAVHNETGTITISGGTVSATTGRAVHNNSTGLITVSGTALVTSANVTAAEGTIYLATATGTDARLIIEGGTVRNTATTANSRAVYNASTGAVTISGGTVSATTGYAVFNDVTGAITISGGTVSATTGRAVHNNSTGAVTISGGTVSTTSSGYAVYNSTGAVNISGGTVEAPASTGNAITNYSTGTITVSGDAVVTSGIIGTSSGTIVNSGGGSITITGGTVKNTANNANARVLYNSAAGRVTISGGTVDAGGSDRRAVHNNAAGIITLNGDPAITGVIFQNSTAAVNVTGTPTFAPSTGKVYTLVYATTPTHGTIAVTGGAGFLNNFTLNNSGYILAARGGSLMIINAGSEGLTPDGTQYTITGTGTFTAARGGTTVGTANESIQTVIDAIRTDALGASIGIQFGDNTTPLDISTASAQFNNTGGTWGPITLTGKITSTNATAAQGTVNIGNGVSIISTADIANTADDANGRAIYNANTSTGGTVTVSGGTVSATTGRAFHNNSTGAVTISGTTVSATTGYAFYNYGAGAVTISGGMVEATTGVAVYNASTGLITVSGTAQVTSANVTSSSGTIYLATATGTDTRLIIEGGEVRTTATQANGRAVYNASTGAVTISGGTVTVGSGNGYAFYNASTGAVTISGGTVSALGYIGNAFYNASTGAVTISGGTVSAEQQGRAVWNSGNGIITLSGDPIITGPIFQGGTAALSLSNFSPAVAVHYYTLDFGDYTANRVAVTGVADANMAAHFILPSDKTGWRLVRSGSDVVLMTNP